MTTGHSLATAHQLYEWACLLFDVGLASYLVIGFVRRERAGRILLDLGRINQDRSTQRIVIGVFQMFVGFLGVLLTGTRDFRWSFFVFSMLQGVNNVVTGMQRFLICEAGILSTERLSQIKLYRWDDILCYDVEQAKLRLKLRDKGPLGERWLACRPKVRLDYREELDAVLASRCLRLKVPVEV
jgi:hypothetical protein